MMRPNVSGLADTVEPSRTELLSRYHAYRRRQARGLLHMIPREAIRPLCRRAVAAGSVDEDSSDPMEALLRYCDRLLPLPPFDVWLQDARRSPESHLYDVGAAAGAPTVDAPVTVETRRFSVGVEPWSAHLRSFRDGDTWRGFIAFEGRGPDRVHRTALIFREPDAVRIRERFLSFHPAALAAVLRSALP
jgi:hypothetical protein